MKAVNGLAERCANKKEGNQNHISRFQFNKGKIMGIFDWLFGDTDDEEAQLEDTILMDMDDQDD